MRDVAVVSAAQSPCLAANRRDDMADILLPVIREAVGALFHAVDAGGVFDRMATGMRVRARWRRDRVGDLRDIECFEALP